MVSHECIVGRVARFAYKLDIYRYLWSHVRDLDLLTSNSISHSLQELHRLADMADILAFVLFQFVLESRLDILRSSLQFFILKKHVLTFAFLLSRNCKNLVIGDTNYEPIAYFKDSIAMLRRFPTHCWISLSHSQLTRPICLRSATAGIHMFRRWQADATRSLLGAQAIHVGGWRCPWPMLGFEGHWAICCPETVAQTLMLLSSWPVMFTLCKDQHLSCINAEKRQQCFTFAPSMTISLLF